MLIIVEIGYDCTVTASLQDTNNKKVEADFTAELLTELSAGQTAPTITPASQDGTEVNFKLNFANAQATTTTWKTYTFKITGVDKNHKDVIFSQNVTVQVKKLPNPLTALDYQIELQVNGKVANTVEETDKDKRSITAKLYATCNGLFAGYINSSNNIGSQDGSKKMGGTYLIPTGSCITAISGCAIRGVDVFLPTDATPGLISKTAISAKLGANLPSDSKMTFSSVVDDGNNVIDTSNEVAEVGSYSIMYAYSVSGGAVKYVSAPFTVTRDYKTPTAKVSTTNVSNINDFDKIIEEAITTNVDMNNNTSGYESITKGSNGFYKKEVVGVDKYKMLTSSDIVNSDRIVVGYVQVVDNVNADEDWLFYAPVSATFKQK